MFGIGIGEILVIILITFLIAPREIPRVMRKIGELAGAMSRMRNELAEIGRDVRNTVGEDLPARKDVIPEEISSQSRRGTNGRTERLRNK